jgi:hypothetical protein
MKNKRNTFETGTTKEGRSLLSHKEGGEQGDLVDVMTTSTEGEIKETLPLSVDRISEVAQEGKQRKSEPTHHTQNTTASREDQLPNITELKPPAKEKMVRELRSFIYAEIKDKKSKMKEYRKHPVKNAYELSEAVNVLRKLYGILQEIAYKSIDVIKNIWIHVSQKKCISDILK